jgi:hypothetical protein
MEEDADIQITCDRICINQDIEGVIIGESQYITIDEQGNPVKVWREDAYIPNAIGFYLYIE